MAVTLNTHFTNCLCCKIIVVTDVVLKYLLQYSTTFCANYHLGSDMLIDSLHLAPSSAYAFIKIKLASHHLLLYWYQKNIKFYSCIQL